MDVSALTASMATPQFWVAVVQIIWINILLSGDNAVVIALACRELPPRERLWGMVIGAGVASILLIAFTAVFSVLLTLPYLRLAGGIALVWIAIKLLAPQAHDEEDTPEAAQDLWRAVWIVVIADIVMSLDNVIAVAAVAKGQYVLLIIGLSISIPVVIAGSALFLAILERFPWVVWAGGALLGWIAGGLLPGDGFVAQYIARLYGAPVVPSLWPNAQETEEALKAAVRSVLEHDYAWLGRAGQFMIENDLEPISLACAVLGAIFVVLMGMYVVRTGNTSEAEAAPSAKAH
jgi:YjbE family integral membrane protein